MSGKRSRDKGGRGEREVTSIFRERGFDLERTYHQGAEVKGDCRGLPGYHVEVKRQERLSMPSWIDQAETEATAGEVPLVIWRTNRRPWRVDMPLDAFLDLLEQAKGAA